MKSPNFVDIADGPLKANGILITCKVHISSLRRLINSRKWNGCEATTYSSKVPLRAEVDLVDLAGKPQLLYEKRPRDRSAQQILQARQLYLVARVTGTPRRSHSVHSAGIRYCTFEKYSPRGLLMSVIQRGNYSYPFDGKPALSKYCARICNV